MKFQDLRPGARRATLGVVAATLACGGVGIAMPSASADTTYSLHGTIYNLAGSPATDGSFDVYQRGADDPAGSNYPDGYDYDLYDSGTTDTSTGAYAMSVPAGTYYVVYYDDTDGGTYTPTVLVNADKPLDAHLQQSMECTTAGNETGTPQVGQTLTAVPGTFSPDYAKTLTYNWFRYDASQAGDPNTGGYTYIEGVYGPNYTLTSADQGYRVEVDVAGWSNFGTGYCDWTNTPIIQPAPAANPTPAPVVPKTFTFGGISRPAGQAKVGKTLSAPVIALPAGATERFQWYRVSKVTKHGRTITRAIPGAHASKYKAKKKDKGSQLFVRIVASAPGYNTATVNSPKVKVH